jgi:hypothetical protein
VEEVEDTVEAKDHQREVMVGDKVAATEDLQELHLFTFMFTFIQHLPHLIPSRAHQRLPTVEDILVMAVNLVVMEDQPEVTLLHRVRNLINNQPLLPNLIPSRSNRLRQFTFTFIQDLSHLIPSRSQRLLTVEGMEVVLVNLVVMEDQPEVTLLRRLPNLINNRFLLMEGNKEDRQEDTLLPLRTSQLQLLLMVLLLSLLEVIRTSNFSSRKIKINP